MLCSIKIGVFSTILGYETLFRTSLWHMTQYCFNYSDINPTWVCWNGFLTSCCVSIIVCCYSCKGSLPFDFQDVWLTCIVIRCIHMFSTTSILYLYFLQIKIPIYLGSHRKTSGCQFDIIKWDWWFYAQKKIIQLNCSMMSKNLNESISQELIQLHLI